MELQPGADVDLEDEIVVVRGGDEGDGIIRGLWIYEEGEDMSTAGLRGEVESLVRSCVEAVQVDGVDHDSWGDVAEERYTIHEHRGRTNGTHILPTDTSIHQQEQNSPVRELAPDASYFPPQPQPQPKQDKLGALFHRAIVNYQGS